MGTHRLSSRLINFGLVGMTATCLSACGSSHGTKKDRDREDYLNETSTNWAMVRGYPRGTAYNPFEEELNPKTVHALETIWESESTARFVIQHGERVFSTAGEAYDLETGEVLWSTGAPLSNLVVCKGTLLTTSAKTDDAEGNVVGMAPASGDARAASSLPDALDLLGSPVAKDSAIVFGTVTDDWRDADTAAHFVAYDLVDKASRRLATPRRGLRSLAPVAITSGQFFAPALEPAGSGKFKYVVFAATLDAEAAGKREDWATTLETRLDAESAELPEVGAMVLAGRVLAPSGNRRQLFALDQRTGAVLWNRTASVRIDSMAVNFDNAFVAGTNAAGELVVEAFAVESGRPHFSQNLGEATLTGQIVLAGDVLYLGSSEGELIAVDATKGDLLNRVELGGEVGNPIVTHGRVFASNGSSVLALGLPRSTAAE